MRVIRLLSLLMVCASAAYANSYTTTFPLTENPISEGGNWINGQVVGIDWSNCATTGGKVIGQENSPPIGQADATALLTGIWAADQTVTVTLFKGAVVNGTFPEAEIRLRSALAAHSNTGYEVLLSMQTGSGCYFGVVKWNGALSDFTVLTNQSGAMYDFPTGTIIKASMIGTLITLYTNGIEAMHINDSTYSTGKPGIGFDHNGSIGNNSTFAFTSFTATDTVATTNTTILQLNAATLQLNNATLQIK